MGKGIIFDLDMTLVNTMSLFELRKNRDWSNVYKRINETFLFDGMRNFILDCNHNFQLGIVTSSPASYAKKVISYHKIDIPILIAYHDTKMHKPHPEPLLKGIEKLGINNNETYCIGDEMKDISAANAAGAISIGVTWGLNNKTELSSMNPEYICDSISQLRNILNG